MTDEDSLPWTPPPWEDASGAGRPPRDEPRWAQPEDALTVSLDLDDIAKLAKRLGAERSGFALPWLATPSVHWTIATDAR